MYLELDQVPLLVLESKQFDQLDQFYLDSEIINVSRLALDWYYEFTCTSLTTR